MVTITRLSTCLGALVGPGERDPLDQPLDGQSAGLATFKADP
jgi:hypothetical protein